MPIRRAKKEESEILSDMTFRSKAYWGYDSKFMSTAREDLAVTEECIFANHVYVLEIDTTIVGYYTLINENGKKMLDALFIDPDYIGRGFGRILWESIVKQSRELNIDELTLLADPHAEGFYTKMGAIRTGECPSAIFEGRRLPLLKYKIQYEPIGCK